MTAPQTFTARLCVPVVGRRVGHATPRLQQSNIRGDSYIQAPSTSVSSQCHSQADTQVISSRAHYTFIPRTPLVFLRSRECINFKLPMLVYRCLCSLSLHYLSDHFQRVASYNRRRLHSSFIIIVTDATNTTHHSWQPFRWPEANSLPHVVTSAPTLTVFRNRLKPTHLLICSSTDWHLYTFSGLAVST